VDIASTGTTNEQQSCGVPSSFVSKENGQSTACTLPRLSIAEFIVSTKAKQCSQKIIVEKEEESS